MDNGKPPSPKNPNSGAPTPSNKEGTPNKTVVRPSKPKKKAPPADGTVIKPRSKPAGASQKASANQQNASNNQEVALTQIRQSIVKQDSSRGFELAKQAANKALANNKIILNNRFVLEKTLGAGGMGTVYKAKDLRKIEANDANPYVAVKVLNEDFKNHPDAFVSLQREASRSHTLSHPNIVTVHDFDRDDDVIYMTMELLEGDPLDVFLRQARNQNVSLEKTLSIAKDVCSALAYAHEKGIIHSDLKPGNIFITKEGAKVLDFGIARLTTANDSFDSGSLGALTPAYASLEMINGEAPDPSDDIYAIGIIIYELIAGKHPYDRLSADKALDKKLKPEKLSKLNKKQWAALESTLKLTRNKRTSSVNEFVQNFLNKKKFPIFKLTSVVLLIATGVLWYFFKSDNIHSHMENTLQTAAECLQAKDYPCAIEKYEAVLELDPKHGVATSKLAVAQSLLKALKLEELETQATQCFNNQDLDCLKLVVSKVSDIDNNSNTYKTTRQALEDLKVELEVAELITTAKQCESNSNLACAKDALEQALAIQPTNPETQTLYDAVVTRISQEKDKQAALTAAYNKALKEGDKCMGQSKFDCAVTKYEEAMNLRPNNQTSISKHQNALFSLKKKEENDALVARLLSRSKDCLNKKKYNCAITNAQSALEYSPSSKAAKNLLNKAKTEQDRIKQNFSIQ